MVSVSCLLALMLVMTACATADGPADGTPAQDPTDASTQAGDAAITTTDAQPVPIDAGTRPDAQKSSALDPDLSLPDPSGEACSYPGDLQECAGTKVCRFFDVESGRCESCETCGNLNAFCSASDQCDILFMCFQGRCANFCTLGTSECGPIDDCIDIGHATRGVCRPF